MTMGHDNSLAVRGAEPRSDVATGHPVNRVPQVHLRNRGGRWRAYWSVKTSCYEVCLGPMGEQDAEVAQLELSIALRTNEWPPWARTAPAVVRWVDGGIAAPDEDIVAVYERHVRGEVSSSWAGTSLAALRELAEVSRRRLLDVTPADAQAYLDHVLRTRGPWLKKKQANRSRATRNRVRAACSRFYRWCIATGRVRENPFRGTHVLREADVAEIVHLARAERDAVLAAADGDPDGLAAWIALAAGLRLGEVIACEWAQIDVEKRKLCVPRTKTGRRRVVDIAGGLLERLKRVPAARRAGPVVVWSRGDVAEKFAAELLVRRLCAACPEIEARRIGWNPFRHTFASLLVQAGVSVFKVASWLGNDPKVCARHYAAMRPDFDPDVERMP